MPTFPPTTLESFACDLLRAGGTSADEAKIVAASLVEANLKGYDSHGVMRVPYYVQAIKDGEVVPGTELAILDEGPSRVVADGNWGLGQVQAMRLLKLLAAKAHESGLGLGTMLHSGHIGRLGEYCEKSAAEGLVSMLMVGMVAALVPSVVLLARHGSAARKMGIPFAPFLAFGALVALFAGDALLDAYLGHF